MSKSFDFGFLDLGLMKIPVNETAIEYLPPYLRKYLKVKRRKFTFRPANESPMSQIADFSHRWSPGHALLLTLEKELSQAVVGQTQATQRVAGAVRRSISGFHEKDRVLASFCFTGPPGVGKSELAKRLAASLYPHEGGLLVLDMIDYADEAAAERLVGPPSRSRSHDEPEGVLLRALAAHQVIVFDGIERAHPGVHAILAQLLEAGRGGKIRERKIDLSRIILIAITASADLASTGLPADLLDRFDDHIAFEPLQAEDLAQIVRIELDNFQINLKSYGLSLECSEALIEWIAKHPLSAASNGRSVKRMIDRTLLDPLLLDILDKKYLGGGVISATLENDSPVFRFTAANQRALA